eukprot:Selendium_serpulae@DN6200_c2_g1_i7.p1
MMISYLSVLLFLSGFFAGANGTKGDSSVACNTSWAHKDANQCFLDMGFEDWGWTMGPFTPDTVEEFKVWIRVDQCEINGQGMEVANLTSIYVGDTKKCVRNRNCHESPWCNDLDYVDYCPDNGALDYCPEPFCMWLYPHTVNLFFAMHGNLTAHKIQAHVGNEPLPKDSNGNPTITIGEFPYQSGVVNYDYHEACFSEAYGEVYVLAHVDTCKTPPIGGDGDGDGDGDAASTKPTDGDGDSGQTEPVGGDGDGDAG